MLIQFSGCDTCTLRSQWPFLANPRMPITPPTVEEIGYPRILVIGEGPGENEDNQGIPFVGIAGKFIRERIPDKWKQRLYWTNMVRCRPPSNRTPSLAEVACCSNYLEQDLLKIRPHAILCIGGVSLDFFWEGAGITSARGVHFPIQLTDGTWTWGFSTFHPSYVNRGQRRDGSNTIEPVFRGDLENFFNKAYEYLTPPNPPRYPSKNEVVYPKTKEEVQGLFNRLSSPYGYDIETFKLKPHKTDARIVTAAFSDGDLTFAFPVDWYGSYKSTWGMEALLWCLQQDKPWVAHSAGFELAWTWYYCNNFNQVFQDTAAAARIKYGRNTLLELEEQSRIQLGIDIKKVTNVDAKRIMSYPLDKVLYYNALDAWACKKMLSSLVLTDAQEYNYRRMLRTIKSTVTMELLGVPVDLEATATLKSDLSKKIKEIQYRAQALPEVQQFSVARQKAFSLTAPEDIAKVLTEYCGFTLPKTEKGNWTTAEPALQEIAGKHPLVDLTLDSREIEKLLSTYIDPVLTGKILGSDGWFHSSYAVILTNTLRLSSKAPNMQNFPKRKNHEVRRQIIPPPGHVIVSFDYGQLEARGYAMATKDNNLRNSFIRKQDIHNKWLNRLIDLYPKYLDRLAEKTGQTEEKAIRKEGRTIIKTDFVFASFYGSTAKNVADRTTIPLSVCEALLSEFWNEYPDVKRWVNAQFEFYQQHGYIEALTGLRRNEVMPGNEPVNNLIQHLSAHIVLSAQDAIWELALQESDICLVPRINVHDDLTFFLLDDSDLERRIDLIANMMVEPRFFFSDCPLIVEGKIGYNWSDIEDIGIWEGDYIVSKQ